MNDINNPGYAEDEVVVIKPKKLFQFDGFTRRPCVRETLLYPINLAVVFGLARFMMTSSVKKSLVWAAGSYWIGAFFFAARCSANLVVEKHKVHQLEPLLQSYAEIYGTEKDRARNKFEDNDD